MALTRLKTLHTTIPESKEAQAVVLAVFGTDGKPYGLTVDQTTGTLPVSVGSASPVTIKETIYRDYSTAGVTTAAWVELIASTSDIISTWSVFDGSGEVLELGVGALGAETRFALIQPGGGDVFEHQIPAGSRISIKAITANVTDGWLVVNAWS